LHHEQKADRSYLDGFMATEYQSELMSLMNDLAQIHELHLGVESMRNRLVGFTALRIAHRRSILPKPWYVSLVAPSPTSEQLLQKSRHPTSLLSVKGSIA
jgi:hypothetical protein